MALMTVQFTLDSIGYELLEPVNTSLLPVEYTVAKSMMTEEPASPPRPLKIPTSLVRGVLAERVVVSTPLDPFLSIKALSVYSGLSVRKLRDCLEQPQHPLPCYRVGGKILVRRSEFDAWITTYRHQGRRDVDTIVSEVLRDLPPSRGR